MSKLIETPDIKPEALASLQSKVGVHLVFGSTVGISLSSPTGKWGKKIDAKVLEFDEIDALVSILQMAKATAERNRKIQHMAKALADRPRVDE